MNENHLTEIKRQAGERTPEVWRLSAFSRDIVVTLIRNEFISGAESGYKLAEGDKDKEIERLKGKIERLKGIIGDNIYKIWKGDENSPYSSFYNYEKQFYELNNL